jgi:hypothetical protein
MNRAFFRMRILAAVTMRALVEMPIPHIVVGPPFNVLPTIGPMIKSNAASNIARPAKATATHKSRRLYG